MVLSHTLRRTHKIRLSKLRVCIWEGTLLVSVVLLHTRSYLRPIARQHNSTWEGSPFLKKRWAAPCRRDSNPHQAAQWLWVELGNASITLRPGVSRALFAILLLYVPLLLCVSPLPLQHLPPFLSPLPSLPVSLPSPPSLPSPRPGSAMKLSVVTGPWTAHLRTFSFMTKTAAPFVNGMSLGQPVSRWLVSLTFNFFCNF